MRKGLSFILVSMVALSPFVFLPVGVQASSEVKQLTKNNLDDALGSGGYSHDHPLSWDGSKLVFSTRYSDLDSDLYIMNTTDNLGQEKLMTTAPGLNEMGSISADGSKLVFISDRKNPNDPWLSSEVFIMNTTDTPGDEVQITDDGRLDHDPDISGNGGIIAWHSSINSPLGFDIKMANISDMSDVVVTELPTGPKNDEYPSLTYDGTFMTFWRNEYQGEGDIYLINSNGTGLEELTGSPYYEWNQALTGDGSKVAFQRKIGWEEAYDYTNDIFVFDIVHNTSIQLTNNDDNDRLGGINGDGTMVTYSRDGHIFAHDLTKEIQLTYGDFNDRHPRISGDGSVIVFESNRDGPDYDLFMIHLQHIIDVPFHYQTVDYYCGPACLEMVFDYYGENISQLEIAEVARTYPYSTYTDELRRATHFSNISTSMGTEMPENITGYTLRQLGYAAFEQWGITIDQLKTLIDNDFPIILLMWYSPNHVSGHYRVAVGYNNTHIILHDPWNNVEWGGTYGGPCLAFNYSTFLDLWQYSGYWGLFTSPWHIKIDTPSNVQQGDSFTVTANITYPCPAPFLTSDYPSSLCNATIMLPTGLILAEGEIAKKPLGNIFPANSVILNWTVKAENCGTYNLTVETEGKVAGSVSAHGIFPNYNYEDRIGAKSSRILEVFGYDVSTKNIISSKTIVGQGYNVTMNVTIKNEGSFMETFNLTVYANTTSIATLTNVTLTSGSSTIITFTWNTTGFAKGNYTIWAYAWPVRDETDISDNNCTGGCIAVTIPGDVDGNLEVDIYDVTAICVCYDSKIGDPMYHANCDVDGNGIIDIYDVTAACITYGQKYP